MPVEVCGLDFSRDAAGAVGGVERPGDGVTSSRDSRGRLTAVSRGSDSVDLAWDGDILGPGCTACDEPDEGRLSSVQTESGVAHFDYQPAGGVSLIEQHLDWSDPRYSWMPGPVEETRSVAYEFDARGRVTAVVYPGGERAEYGWQDAGGLDTIDWNDGATTQPLVTSTRYSVFGDVAHRAFVNGVTESTERGDHGLVTGWELAGVPERSPCTPWAPGAPALLDEPCLVDGAVQPEEPPLGPSVARGQQEFSAQYLYTTSHQLLQRTRIRNSVFSPAAPVVQGRGYDEQDRLETVSDGSMEFEFGYSPAGLMVSQDATSLEPFEGDDPADVHDFGTFGERAVIRDLPIGGGFVPDEDEGTMSLVLGEYGVIHDRHGRPVLIQDESGLALLSLAYDPQGRLAVEFDEVTLQGRRLTYGRDDELLLEERYVLATDDWVPYRQFVWDPTTGELVALAVLPGNAHAAPSIPLGLAVQASAEGNLLAWDPVPQADHYVVYRDGYPFKYVDRVAPFVHDVEALPGVEVEYEVRAVSATGQESEGLAARFTRFEPSMITLNWDPAITPAMAGATLMGCRWADMDSYSVADRTVTCTREEPLATVGTIDLLAGTTAFDPRDLSDSPDGWYVWLRSHGETPSLFADSLPQHSRDMGGGWADPGSLSPGILPDEVMLLGVHTSPDGELVYSTELKEDSDGYFGELVLGPVGQFLEAGAGPAEINPTTRELPSFLGGLVLASKGMNVALDGTTLQAELTIFESTWRGRAAAWLDRQAAKIGPQTLVGGLAPSTALGGRAALGMASGVLRLGVGYGLVMSCGDDPDCTLTEEQTWAVGLYGLADAAAVGEMAGSVVTVGGRAAIRSLHEGFEEIAQDAMGSALRGFGDDLTTMARGPSFRVVRPPEITSPSRLLPAPSSLNPDLPGGPIMSVELPVGFRYNQAVAPGQELPGRFGTTEGIPNLSFVRNELGVTSAFKREVAGVREVVTVRPVRAQFSLVGPQMDGGLLRPGRRSQLQILDYDVRNPFVEFASALRPFTQ